MHANIALIAVVSLVLLFGCTGSSVPQEKYDALAASCSKAKNDSAAALSAEVAKTGAATARYSSCVDEKQSLESLLAVREQEKEALGAQAAILANAREKTALAAQYNVTIGYYLEAYGPGKVPNTARLRKIDAQVASLNDNSLAVAWQDVRSCQTITECDTAKAKFIPYINGMMATLYLEAAAIVAEGQ